MTQLLEELDYETKASEYFGYLRPEMVPFLPTDCRRVLDVGCADGTFGEALKKSRGIEVWGVEPTKSAAAKAKARRAGDAATSSARRSTTSSRTRPAG